MKRVISVLLASAVYLPLFAAAADPVIPWADNSGSISSDEQALSSSKPAFAGDPKLMPHQG